MNGLAPLLRRPTVGLAAESSEPGRMVVSNGYSPSDPISTESILLKQLPANGNLEPVLDSTNALNMSNVSFQSVPYPKVSYLST